MTRSRAGSSGDAEGLVLELDPVGAAGAWAWRRSLLAAPLRASRPSDAAGVRSARHDRLRRARRPAEHRRPTTLRALWRRIEDLGFGWISIWDHFYSATAGRRPGVPGGGGDPRRAGLRHDAGAVRLARLLASATATRPCWPTPSAPSTSSRAAGPTSASAPAGARSSTTPTASRSRRSAVRMDQLEEAIQCVRGLLRDEVTDFDGRVVPAPRRPLRAPSPVQAELPIWVGGRGEQRTLRIAAQWADGWNVPFVAPETFAHKRDVLHAALRRRRPRPRRDPHRRQRRAWRGPRRACASSSAAWPTSCGPGVLTGSDEEVHRPHRRSTSTPAPTR